MQDVLNFETLSKFIYRINPESANLITPYSSLIGQGKVLDSLGLVQLCVILEDFSVEQGFNFDWTSETAMSRSQSMFRDVQSLLVEFNRQFKAAN